MGVKSASSNFEITNISGSKEGIFTDPYHVAVHEEEALLTANKHTVKYSKRYSVAYSFSYEVQ